MQKEKYLKEKREWIDLYNYGYSTIWIGREYGFTHNAVYKKLMRCKVSIRPSGQKITAEERAVWVQMLKDGATINEIAKATYCTGPTVRKHLKSLGLRTSDRIQSDAEKEDWVVMYGGGETIDGIAESQAVHAGTVWSHIAKVKHGSASRGMRYKKGYLVYTSGKNRHRAVHRVVMEECLKRPLTRAEVVHHIDGDGLNNEIENLMVFKSGSSHMAFHRALRERGEDLGDNVSRLGMSL